MRRARPCRLALLLIALFLLPSLVSAKEGFYLGAGLGAQSVYGGLDGHTIFFDEGGGSTIIFVGRPSDNGLGLALNVGYAFTPHVSLDYLRVTTSHTAAHNSLDFSSNMALATNLLGVRFAFPAQENIDLTARIGLATATAVYDSYGVTPFPTTTLGFDGDKGSATLSGSGVGAGVGVEILSDQTVFSINCSLLNIAFTEGNAGSQSGRLPKALSSRILQLTFLVTHFFN